MYSVIEKRKAVARVSKSIAIKLESGSTDDEVMTEVFVNNASIVDQLSEEDLCRILLKMCRATDEEDEREMINTTVEAILRKEAKKRNFYFEKLEKMKNFYSETLEIMQNFYSKKLEKTKIFYSEKLEIMKNFYSETLEKMKNFYSETLEIMQNFYSKKLEKTKNFYFEKLEKMKSAMARKVTMAESKQENTTTLQKTNTIKKTVEKKSLPEKATRSIGIKKRFLKTKNVCRVTFRLPKVAAPAAKSVSIVGDFNNWNTHANPMKKLKDGDYSIKLDLEPRREYQFRCLIDELKWENDRNADKYMRSVYGDDDNRLL